MDRRNYLKLTAGGLAIIAGCTGEDGSDIQDSDGDGVIDSEDYAPSDPEVQEKSDLRQTDTVTRATTKPTQTATTTTSTKPTSIPVTTTTTITKSANELNVDDEYWNFQSRITSYSSEEIWLQIDSENPKTDENEVRVFVAAVEFPRGEIIDENLSSKFNRGDEPNLRLSIDLSDAETVEGKEYLKPEEQDPKYHYIAGFMPGDSSLEDINYSDLVTCMETDPFHLRPDRVTIERVDYPAELDDEIGDNYSRNDVEGAYSTEISGRTHGENWTVSYFFYKSAHAAAVNTNRGRSREEYVSYELTEGAAGLMATLLKEDADSLGFSDFKAVDFVIDFVQALPYVPDDVSKGYDDYTKFMLETLPEMGGDCEDTAIMLASILETETFNYDMVLIEPPGHMAVGIWNSDPSGYHYEYDGRQYEYIETTGGGWGIGDMPEEYEGERASIYQV